MKKKFGMISKVLALTLTAGLLVTGCGNSDSGSSEDTGSATDKQEESADSTSGELTPVRLGIITGNIDHLIVAVGLEKGFFEKNGINLQTTDYASGPDSMDGVTMGVQDVAVSADFAVLNRIGNSEKTELKVVTNISKMDGGKLYANPDTVKSKEDLKGKKLINQPGVVTEYWNELAIKNIGLKEGEYELVNVDSMPSAIAAATSGEGDTFWGSGDIAAQLEEIGWKPIMTFDDVEATSTVYLITKEEYAKNNADTLKKLYAGFTESIEYIENNVDESAQIIEAKVGLKADKFKLMLDTYELGIQFKKSTFDYLDGVNNWLKDNKYYQYPFETKDILLIDAAKEEYPDAFEI